MKNKESIEANFEENHASQQAQEQAESRGDRIKPWRWKKGQSGNPGGRKKDDMAEIIAQAVFEENKELVYQSMCKVLRKGSAFGFQVLSDRAYGKVKESLEVDINTSEDLVNRLRAGMKRLAK